MNKSFITGSFKTEHDILEATEATRRSGYKIYDVFTPYAVHGLDKAMGLRPSRLTYVCFLFAVLGVAAAIFVQFWIGSIDWPLNVGGKPFNSLPAYLPVSFEVTVLFAGLGVVFTMFFRTKLFPGKATQLIHPKVTNNCFVLALEVTDASLDEIAMKTFWEKFGVDEVQKIAGVQ